LYVGYPTTGVLVTGGAVVEAAVPPADGAKVGLLVGATDAVEAGFRVGDTDFELAVTVGVLVGVLVGILVVGFNVGELNVSDICPPRTRAA